MIEIELGLANPGFEEGWREVDGVYELKVANSWYPWWHETDVRPEYKIATTEVDDTRVYEGQAAQQWFTTYASHTGGIYQQVMDVPVGKEIIFEAYVQTFARDDDLDWHESNGRYRMRIGIDPYGGTDGESDDIVWTEAVQPYDEWSLLRIETLSRSDRCTLFVWGQAEWRVKHNNAYVDGCRCFYLDDEPEPPPPPPPPEKEPATAEDLKRLAHAFWEYAKAIEQAGYELSDRLSEWIE